MHEFSNRFSAHHQMQRNEKQRKRQENLKETEWIERDKGRREDWPRLITRPRIGWSPPWPQSKAAMSLPFFWRQGPIEMFSRRRPYLCWVPILDRNYVSWFPMPLVLWGRKLIVSCFSHSWWPKLWDFPNRPELYRSVCVERFLSGPNCLFPPLFYALGIVGR